MFSAVEKFIKKAIHALIVFFIAVILFYFIDIQIPVNFFTISIVIVLALPGVFLILFFALGTYFFL